MKGLYTPKHLSLSLFYEDGLVLVALALDQQLSVSWTPGEMSVDERWVGELLGASLSVPSFSSPPRQRAPLGA